MTQEPQPAQNGPTLVRAPGNASVTMPPEGMDRRIVRRRWTPTRIGAGLLVAGGLIAAAWTLLGERGMKTFRIDASRVSIATVTNGQFEDFVPIRGTVAPARSVYLDAVEGGRVEQILVEEGSIVEAGQALVRLSNTQLQLDVISREAEVSEQLNNLRNTRLALEQNRLSLKSDLVEIDYQVQRLGRLVERRGELADKGLISRQDYEDVLDELAYNESRREVTIESQEQDERLRIAQIAGLESSVEQLEQNLTIARANLDNLLIRAPVGGHLTSLDAEIGESKARGQRLGQIDSVDTYKISALVDEFYVTRVRRDQTAEMTLAGASYPLVVTKVYPEVRGGQFEMDLAFSGEVPDNLRRGQTLQIRLRLGDASDATLLPRGGFFQDTGGDWVFVVSASGETAEKRDVRLGRRNPEHFEVLSGLTSGERVVVSQYTGFTDIDRIEFRN